MPMAQTLPEQASAGSPPGQRTEQRISWLTLALGLAAAAVVAIFRKYLWAFGLAIGTGLAWLNFRLLRRGLDALLVASTAQSDTQKPQVPLASYAAAALRYGLIAGLVYAIFVLLKVPLLSMIVGLCALGAAAIAASVYEISRPADQD
jgi:small-conductance mechanosensitive channel